MTLTRLACLGLMTLATVSCSSVSPVKVEAGDRCYRCRRSISDERVAGEAIYGPQFVAKFRGPGCMAKYLVAHPDEKPVLFVTDYASGKMIAPQGAFYVSEVLDRNTGESDYRAYQEQADAAAFAAETHATLVAWNAVLEQAR
jgi:NosL protein